MNALIRKILNLRLRAMLTEAKAVSGLNHSGLIGRLREIFLHSAVTPLLNSSYSAGAGKVTDYEGNLSKEMDLCVYGKSLLPPVFFSAKQELGVYPVESVLACFEVKSMLTTQSIRDAFQKFSYLDKTLKFTPGLHGEQHQSQKFCFMKPEYSIFAYDISRKVYKKNAILQMYKLVDPQWERTPLVSSICVAGKGSWVFSEYGWLHMLFHRQTMSHEEIIFYLCALIQGFPSKELSRGTPRIGYYLTNPNVADRLKDGVVVESSTSHLTWAFTNTTIQKTIVA